MAAGGSATRRGSPWRDPPEAFGDWSSAFRRFGRWSWKGVWQRIFAALARDPDVGDLVVDTTLVRARRHAAGAKQAGA